MTRRIEIIEENGVPREETHDTAGEERTARLVALGQAFSDPIRVGMLGMMAEGRGCCDLPDIGAPVAAEETGICVCEFQDYFGMGQSKVSYHVRKLKEAGLVREQRRGKWSFYSLDGEAAAELLGEAAVLLLPSGEERGKVRVVDDGCC